MTKSTRLIEVMEYIKLKKSFTVQELADHFNVSYKTMWRYLQELSTLLPLYSVSGVNGGYSILEADKKKSSVCTVVQRETSFHVGYTISAPYDATSEVEILVPRLWLKLLSQLEEIEYVKQPIVKTGISIFREKDHRYDITVEVERIGHFPIEMESFTLDGRTYANGRHIGNLEHTNTVQSYENIYEWVKQNGLKVDSRSPHIELYGPQFYSPSKQASFDIFVPVFSA